jgi:hypothetical protein
VKPKLIPKVKSLNELRNLAKTDERYAKLLLAGAENLGGMGYKKDDLDGAYQYLCMNADETDEKCVVAEVNFVRDCI